MDDFNNVLGTQDRVGGKSVQEAVFIDLIKMMENIGLFEVERKGDWYTWSNKHS